MLKLKFHYVFYLQILLGLISCVHIFLLITDSLTVIDSNVAPCQGPNSRTNTEFLFHDYFSVSSAIQS